jgi:hypothetical protein
MQPQRQRACRWLKCGILYAIQRLIEQCFSLPWVEDSLTEANEMYQNAREQGRRQDDSDDPHRH